MYSRDDIPYSLALDAYRCTSFDPEGRARAEQQEYVRHMDGMVQKYGHLPGAGVELERYRDGYIKHLCAWLQARTRVMSPMITGPAKFPWARNEKAQSAEQRRLEELIRWEERAIDRIERNLGLRQSPISSDDPLAVEKLEAKLADLVKTHEAMKAANRQARAKGEQVPYLPWELCNSNANIRRIKERIADLNARAQDVTTEIDFPGGSIIDNVEDNRVQIVFDGKPDAEVRDQLKANGFRWAPSVGAWQRQRTVNAMWAAKRIAGVE